MATNLKKSTSKKTLDDFNGRLWTVDNSGKTLFIAEVISTSDEKEIKQKLKSFKEFLFNNNIRTGMIISFEKTFILIDNFATDDENTFECDEIKTSILLKPFQKQVAFGYPLFFSVRDWLYKFVEDWESAVPKKYIPYFIPDIVGNTVKCKIEAEY